MKRYMISTYLKLCILLVAVAQISGCASTWAKTRAENLAASKKAIDAAVVCCKSLAEFDYSNILKTDHNTFRIDKNSKAFLFPSGKSFFAAFTLPAYKKPYAITVESYLDGGTSFIPEMHIFHPALLFLDKNYKPVVFLNNLPFRWDRGWVSSGLQAHVRLNHEFETAKYLVIFTQASLVSKTFTAEGSRELSPAYIGGSTVMIPTNARSRHTIPFNYEGELNLIVKN